MKKLLILALSLVSLAAGAQTSSVTSTLTDTDGTLWKNGTCTVTLQWSTTKYPTTTPYRIDGGPSVLVPQHPSCTVNGSGVLSVTVTDVKWIFPPQSTWLFTVCPNVFQGNLGCGVTQVPVTGASVDLTGTLKVPAARVGGGIGAFAYADVEVAPLWNNFYWNTTTGQCRQWQNSWADCGSGAAGVPGVPNTSVQYNNAGVFAGDPVFTFDNSGKKVTVGPLGTANSGANFNSGTLQVCDSYWTGSAAAPGCWSFQDTPLSGTNPYDILTVLYTGSPTSGQINFPFSEFIQGFALNADNGSGIVQFKGPANVSTSYSIIMPDVNPTSPSQFTCTPTDSTHCTATWAAGGGSGGIAVTPQQFGGFGDAFSPPDGLSTTASSTTVGCPDGCFLSTDVGKQVWVKGAGASGHAFSATITAYTNSTTVTVSATATATLSNVYGVYGHDDTTAIQSCIKYSSVNAVQCWLVPKPAPVGQNGIVGFLVGTGSLQLTNNNAFEQNSGPSLIGNSQTQGTNLFCEFNGDCLNLAAGPIQGSNVRDVAFEEDSSQPASRGIHLNPQVGSFGNGPFSQASFINVNVDNPALECLWLDGGGGPGYGFNLPNQYIMFTHFWCNGPNQSHPANLIKATGQDLQIIFLNGQVNGQAWNGTSAPNYANPGISITEKTAALGDSPVDIKFFGYTFEVLTQGLFIGNGTNNIHYDNSYVENVATPFIVTGSVADTFNGDHIANSGNTTGVFQFANNSGASVRDALSYGSSPSPAAFAVCSGNNQTSFDNNNSTVKTNSCLYTTVISSGTQGANSCSSPTSKTMLGLSTGSVITPGYSSDPTGLVGWGSTGGMAFKIWPSATDTAQWSVCNATGSPITYGAVTFNLVWK